MSCLLKRFLPFALTLSIGVALASIFNHFLSDGVTSDSLSNAVPQVEMEDCYQVPNNSIVRITQVYDGGYVGHSSSTIDDAHFKNFLAFIQAANDNYVPLDNPPNPLGLTIDDEELFFHHMDFNLPLIKSISYTEPKSIDGKCVAQSAKLLYLPQPSYWQGRNLNHEHACSNVILRLTLSASGEVTDIEPLPILNCSNKHTSEVIEAARRIRFMPALRDGQPVSERVSILYNYF
ncbi:MAG: hypothetical protein AUG51_10880 [Acidobacteria bacterium 13_1_20CM_3_53_8]|nr:MAG: hypothetical protein AUG51_10880 [Acidobacteria bacterium 13_1_20CM_3_53_8]